MSHLGDQNDSSRKKGIWRIPLNCPDPNEITARLLLPALFQNQRRNRNSRKTSGRRQEQRRFTIASEHVVEAKALSNCHSNLYTGEIQLGTPGQSFVVGFDTSTFDLWVPSDRCEETCDLHVWRRYKESESTTAKPVTEEEKEFNQVYGDLEFMQGEHVQDKLDLGIGMLVDDQVFVQVTVFGRLEICEGQEGSLGLGNSNFTEYDFPSVISNLRTILENPIFSIYLDESDDDYPDDPDASLSPEEGANPGDYRPISAHSEIVFGGVNQKHYSGCLHWHEVADIEGDKSLWAFHIQSITSNGKELSGDKTIAVIDTESPFVAGPSAVLGPYLAGNDVECFDLDPFGEAFLVECDGRDGFDAAAIDCEANVNPLEFIADGVSYELSATDLSTRIETSEGDICLLRLISLIGDEETWVFGDLFVNRYYTAFDFGRGRVGLAMKQVENSDKCAEDWPLDVNYDNAPVAPSTLASPSPLANTAENPTAASDAPKPSPIKPQPKKSSEVVSSPPSTGKPSFVAIGLPAFLIVGAMLMVFFISRRRSNSYRRADRYAGDDYDDEVELPGLL